MTAAVFQADHLFQTSTAYLRPGGAAGMIPTAKGQRPESIDISANVYSARSLLIHTLWLEVLSDYREGFFHSNL